MSSERSSMPLSEFITLQRGFDLPSKDRLDGTIPVVASTQITGWHNEAKVDGPGVVIGRSGSIGGGQFIKEDFWPLNTTLWVKNFKGHDPEFVYYLLRSINFERFNVGSGVPTLNRNHLSAVKVPLFEESEEKKIADYLGSIDQKIQLNQQTNETLEAMAQAIFKSWFVDFDPVRAKMKANEVGRVPNRAAMAAIAGVSLEQEWDEIEAALNRKLERMSVEQQEQLERTASLFPETLEESEIGEVPKGWGAGNLGDICSVQGGYAFKSKLFKEEGYPVVKIKSINENYTVDLKNGQFISDEDTIDKETYELNDGDYVLAMTGATVGKTGIIVANSEKVMLNQRVAKFESEHFEGNINWFIHSAFLATNLKDQIVNIARGSAQPNISATGIESAKIIIPSEDLTEKFINIADPLFQKWIDNYKQNETLSSLRDTLLPKLISGEVGV
jgi:type I restriction enzyme S subunit